MYLYIHIVRGNVLAFPTAAEVYAVKRHVQETSSPSTPRDPLSVNIHSGRRISFGANAAVVVGVYLLLFFYSFILFYFFFYRRRLIAPFSHSRMSVRQNTFPTIILRVMYTVPIRIHLPNCNTYVYYYAAQLLLLCDRPYLTWSIGILLYSSEALSLAHLPRTSNNIL